MRTLLISAMALASFGGVAFAENVTVTPAPAPSVVIEHPDAAHRQVTVNKDVGCKTKSVKKSDEMGDSVTHTKSNC